MTQTASARTMPPPATFQTTVPATARAQRRAFIRDHHPDRGGDPAAFITGLAVLDAAAQAALGEPACRAPRMVFYRRPPLYVRLALVLRRWRHPPPPRVQ